VIATGLTASLVLAACGGGGSSGSGGSGATGGASGEQAIVGLVTKTDTNPFFVKMKAGATQAAQQAGVQLQTFAGKQDGDNEAQVQAIENLISAGAKGFMITPTTRRRSCRRSTWPSRPACSSSRWTRPSTRRTRPTPRSRPTTSRRAR
jgi:ABC-type sugar transport system substrate-binding protein